MKANLNSCRLVVHVGTVSRNQVLKTIYKSVFVYRLVRINISVPCTLVLAGVHCIRYFRTVHCESRLILPENYMCLGTTKSRGYMIWKSYKHFFFRIRFIISCNCIKMILRQPIYHQQQSLISHATWTWLGVWKGSVYQFHRRASIRHQARETTTPHAPDKPPSSCLENPAPFFLECICELVDVLWLVRPSPDTFPRMSHKRSIGDRSGDFVAIGESWFCEIAGDLGQHVHDGLLHCRLERWMHSHADGRRAQQ